MNKVLIVVDMQNDFINGSLANSMAENIVEPIANYIREFDGKKLLIKINENI